MNAEVQKISPANSVKLNQIMVSGRIEAVSKYDNRFDHIIITPAADAFSKPALMRVNAAHPLGEVGEECKVLCTYNGWPNNYKTGEGKSVKDVRGFFVAVE